MKIRYMINDITKKLKYEPERSKLDLRLFDTDCAAWDVIATLPAGVYTVSCIGVVS